MTIAEISRNIDKIYITEKDFKKIAKWGKDNLVYEDKPNTTKLMDKRMFFPLKNFVIDIEFKKNTRLTALVELDSFNPVSSGRVTTDDYWYTYKRDFIRRGFDFQREQNVPEQIVRTTHAFITEVLMYICFADRTMEFRPVIERTKSQGEYNPYEYQNRVCFLLDDIVKYAGTHKTRKSIQYQCECWGVRGHLRHYSDGRIVFIEPYKKGRLRNTLEPKNKEYMLTASSEVKE